MPDANTELEDLESFRYRARAWLADNMPRAQKPEANWLQRKFESTRSARVAPRYR